ncbi:hypothetical protein PDJAM_G00130390 [Pangasius djambal]|uniref:Uncharacterized protein n=1 Tax=Pangasius djambal TaxID=1691987 RepID=A0ACC5ZC64_9TELE|nr:hypothetical protein [Pangasius djambal]
MAVSQYMENSAFSSAPVVQSCKTSTESRELHHHHGSVGARRIRPGTPRKDTKEMSAGHFASPSEVGKTWCSTPAEKPSEELKNQTVPRHDPLQHSESTAAFI